MSFASLSVQGHNTPTEKHVHIIIFVGKTQDGGDFFQKSESFKAP